MRGIRTAIRDSSAVGLAASAIGIALGVLVVQSGLAWWWATVFAAVVFAGSLEFVLLGLVTALAPLGQVAAAAFVVNVRHVFYATSFPLHRVPGRLAKAYSTFALTDEAYAVTARPQARQWGRGRILGLQAAVHVWWVGSVTLGALGGAALPAGVVGLDFAVTALFVVLGIDAFRARRDVPTAVVAVGCALVATALLGGWALPAGLGMVTAYLVGRGAVAARRA